MKKLILVLVCLVVNHYGFAQTNLVPNPSFEDTVCCYPSDPDFPAVGWKALSSSDYYRDNYGNAAPVLNNTAGSQIPFDGEGYVGFGVYPIREMLLTKLLQPLEIDKKYCISYYVSKPEKCDYASNGISVYLFADSASEYSYNSLDFIGKTPTLACDSVIYDTLNWVKVESSFIAQGGEQFLVLGNMFTNAQTTWVNTVSTPYWPFSYYWVDMLSITAAPVAEAGTNVTITQGDSTQLHASGGSVYFWQPSTGLSCATCATTFAKPTQTTTYFVTVSDTLGCAQTDSVTITVQPKSYFMPTVLQIGQPLQIDSFPSGAELIIYDVRGREVFRSGNDSGFYPLSDLTAGMYLAVIRREGEVLYQNKILLIR